MSLQTEDKKKNMLCKRKKKKQIQPGTENKKKNLYLYRYSESHDQSLVGDKVKKICESVWFFCE